MFNRKNIILSILVLLIIVSICCLNCNDDKNENQNVTESYVDKNENQTVDATVQNIIKDDNTKSLLATTINNKVVNDEIKNNDLINSILTNENNIKQTEATIDVNDTLIIQDSNKENINIPVGVSMNQMYAGIDETIMNVDVGAFFNDKGALVSSDLLPSKDVNEFSQFNIETP